MKRRRKNHARNATTHHDGASGTLRLEDYKEFFETLGSHVIASATDARGTIIYVNDRFVEVSKYSKAELIGQNHRILKSGAHDPDFYRELWKTIISGRVWRGEIKNRAKDGTYYWVDTSIAPIFGTSTKPEKYVSVRFLITERKQIEEELHKRKDDSELLADATVTLASSLDYEAMLRRLADLMVPRFADWCAIDLATNQARPSALRKVATKHKDPLILTIADRLHEQTHLNATNKRYGPQKVFETGQSEFLPELSNGSLDRTGTAADEQRELQERLSFRSLLRVPIMCRERMDGVITFARAEGRERYTADSLELAEEIGKRAGVAIEHARLYEELQTADRRKDDLIATLAHELRNPLAPLLLRAQLLQRYSVQHGKNEPVLEETAHIVERQAKTMARLLDDLLDMSRLMRGKIALKKELLDVATIIERALETAKPLFEQYGVTLHQHVSAQPLSIYADPLRIEQVIVNLLNNAAKYNRAGGNIWITAVHTDRDVAIRVRDDGLGIHPDVLESIFSLFVQGEGRETRGGLGIGLALSRDLVVLHGGTLSASSKGEGKGAEFVVTLPIATDMRKDPSGPAILIVDDNEDAANALASYLTFTGYGNVKTASNGEEAIAALRAFLPNYVFLDIRMPGMDGYETLLAMQSAEALRETTFIAVTGYGQEEDKRKAREAGFDHHFTKPVDAQSIVRVLEQHTTAARR